MELRFVPLAGRFFEEEPEAQSLLYCIAQFWCDEALDAVHEELVPCQLRDPPPWPECLIDNPFVDAISWQNLPTEYEIERWAPTMCSLSREFHALDENSTMVTAFASRVPEATSQSLDLSRSYLPYAIARRAPGRGVELEVVGRIERPEWEDASSAERREALVEEMTRPPGKSPAPSEIRPWWRRLFGLR